MPSLASCLTFTALSLATGLAYQPAMSFVALFQPAAERFTLSAAPAAAVGYPMEVVEGRFLSGEKAGFPIAPEYLAGRWGLSAIGYGVGNPVQPVPDRFWVRWYSYAEDKFYEGHFPLPQPRLTALLRQGYWNDAEQQQQTYSELTLCLLPKGVVVLWLTGGNQVLVGRYEAPEITYDFRRFNAAANRPRMVAQEQAKLPPAVQQEIQTRTLSTRRWDTYLATYPWQLAVSPPAQLETYSLTYLSAERTRYPATPDLAAHRQALLAPHPHPVPAHLLLVLQAADGQRRKIRVDAFDEAETLAAFQTLHAARPTAPLTLAVETDASVTQARFYVKNDQQALPLTKVKLAVYSAD